KTIATAQGIYADALFAGTLWLTNEMNIESADGYLNVTGSRFTMRSKTNSKNAVEITPEGITIRGFDGRELIVDGIMKGTHMANITTWNDPAYVEFTGRDMQCSAQEWSSVYVLWDEFKGRFLNLRGTARLRDQSPCDSINIDITMVEVGTGAVLFEERKFIKKS